MSGVRHSSSHPISCKRQENYIPKMHAGQFLDTWGYASTVHNDLGGHLTDKLFRLVEETKRRPAHVQN